MESTVGWAYEILYKAALKSLDFVSK